MPPKKKRTVPVQKPVDMNQVNLFPTTSTRSGRTVRFTSKTAANSVLIAKISKGTAPKGAPPKAPPKKLKAVVVQKEPKRSSARQKKSEVIDLNDDDDSDCVIVNEESERPKNIEPIEEIYLTSFVEDMESKPIVSKNDPCEIIERLEGLQVQQSEPETAQNVEEQAKSDDPNQILELGQVEYLSEECIPAVQDSEVVIDDGNSLDKNVQLEIELETNLVANDPGIIENPVEKLEGSVENVVENVVTEDLQPDSVEQTEQECSNDKQRSVLEQVEEVEEESMVPNEEETCVNKEEFIPEIAALAQMQLEESVSEEQEDCTASPNIEEKAEISEITEEISQKPEENSEEVISNKEEAIQQEMPIEEPEETPEISIQEKDERILEETLDTSIQDNEETVEETPLEMSDKQEICILLEDQSTAQEVACSEEATSPQNIILALEPEEAIEPAKEPMEIDELMLAMEEVHNPTKQRTEIDPIEETIAEVAKEIDSSQTEKSQPPKSKTVTFKEPQTRFEDALNIELKPKEKTPKKTTRREPKKAKPRRPPKSETNKPARPKKEKKDCSKKYKEEDVRRSSRIKSIAKPPPKGHGVVKNVDLKTTLKIDSDKNPEGTQTETNEQKPVKVKSRWRKSCELEMNNQSVSNAIKENANAPEKSAENGGNHVALEKPTRSDDKQEVTMRLKQFVHLKENLYLTDRMVCKEAKKITCDCYLTKEDLEKGEYGCGDECLNRLLMIECGTLCPVGDRCTNKKFQKTQFAPVEVFKTDKKGLGLRAAANIPFGDFILEYVGEVLDHGEFDRRADDYSKDKNRHYYFMSLRADAIIDATQKGNISRFINHSCEPNAETQKWTVNGELRIGFFSTRTILAGEEITFDYQFQRYGKEAQKCFCEAPGCRGWLGEEPEDEDEEDDEDEEEEEEDEESKTAEPKAASAEVTSEVEEQSKTEQPVVVKAAKKERKKKSPRKKPRKDLFEDLDQLDDEIEMLVTTGLKNQAHTLKLSRLMVRAKEPAQRAKLLRILRRGELPCRRLFLDYHGLRLMHGYMTDAQILAKADKKFQSLRLEMLQTLATLPIPNKSMLQDSKVLEAVDKWSTKIVDELPIDSDSSSPQNYQELPANAEVKTEAVAETETEAVAKSETEAVAKSETEAVAKTETEAVAKSETEAVAKSDQVAVEEVKVEPSSEPMEVTEEKPAENIEESVVKNELDNSTVEIVPAEETADVVPPEETPALVPPKETAAVVPPKETPAFVPPKEIPALVPPKETPALIPSKETIASIPLKETAAIVPPKETPVVPSKDPTPAVEPKDENVDETNYEEEITALALKLLEEWASLKEAFKIPRKERLEQLKEHERDANRGYVGNVIVDDEKKNESRYRILKRYRSLDKQDMGGSNRKNIKIEDRTIVNFPQLGKYERRKMFALQVEQREEERRRKQREMWRQHEQHCILLGSDPRLTAPFDPSRGYQCIWNPQIGQWQNYPIPSNTGVIFNPQTHPNYPYLQQNPSMIPGGIHPLPSLPYQEDLTKKQELEDPSQVKFLGPIPPPVKLPARWKCAKDKYGRPYYYHIKMRKSQWEPPPLSQPIEEPDDSSSTTSSSDTSSLSSDTSSDSDSEDDVDDTKLLLAVRKRMDNQARIEAKSEAKNEMRTSIANTLPASFQIVDEADDDDEDSPMVVSAEDKTEQTTAEEEATKEGPLSSVDLRLKELFTDEMTPSPSRKRRAGLVHEIMISPRTEEDKAQFKEDVKRYKINKEKLKKEKELHSKKQSKELKQKAAMKLKVKEMADSNSETAKRIRETFRSTMATTVVSVLNAYRKPDCKQARITNTEDFKHLARKLTHFVMLKEMKHIEKIEELECTENVKAKAREYIKKYMAKFGELYQKRNDEPDF